MKSTTILLLLSCLGLVSCKMNGDLSVHDELTLLKKKNIFSSKLVKVNVPSGEYKASIEVSKSKLKLKVKDVSGKSPSFAFKLNDSINIPSSNGETTISKNVSGQAYDVKVLVDTDVDESSYDTSESCVSHYRHERRCHRVASRRSCSTRPASRTCRTRDDGTRVCRNVPARTTCRTIPAHNVCKDVRVPVYGTQDVTVYTMTSTKNVIASLLDDQTIVAKFDHSNTSTSSYRSRGHCYR